MAGTITTLKSIFMGITAGLIFLISYVFLEIDILYSLAIGFFFYILIQTWQNISDSKRKKSVAENPEDQAWRQAQITKTRRMAEAMKAGKEKLLKMRLYGHRIRKQEIRQKVESICQIGEKIFTNLEAHPEDIKNAKTFLSTYLETAMNIIRKYVELSEQSIQNDSIEQTMERVEDVLDTMYRSFENQLEKLLEDDVIDLDTEITFFEKAIKTDGLDNNK